MLQFEQFLQIAYCMVQKSSGLNKVLAGNFMSGNFLCGEPICIWMYVTCIDSDRDTIMLEVLCVKAPGISSDFFGHSVSCLFKKKRKKKVLRSNWPY